jgi:arylsulfatase A-like enzyme
VNDALQWISQRGTNSWFLWLAFNAGHTPFHKPPNELHSSDALPGTAIHINANPRLYYEAMIEAMDTEMGRLLTNMTRTNANVSLTNTMIIFLGDNGTPRQVIQPPYSASRAKGTLYEGGIRVPLIVAGAGVISPNRVSTEVVHCVDLFATTWNSLVAMSRV